MNAPFIPDYEHPFALVPTKPSLRPLILSAILGACIITITWAVVDFTHPASSFQCASNAYAEK
jgi:hypothetical protein